MADGGAHSGFNDLVADITYPMFVVTTGTGDQKSGCLVGFTTQTSIRPPRFLVCLSKKNRTFRVAQEAEVLVVHLLAKADHDLAELFGGTTGDEVDKFGRCAWKEGPGGAPLIEGCPNWFAGRILDRVDLGDHMGFLLDPIASERGADFPEMDFQSVRDISAGHPA